MREVAKGAQTDVLGKALAAAPGSFDPAKSFSLVTAERSLDVVLASTQDRDTVLRAVRVVFEDAGLAPLYT